jgi:hypothetical protein
MLLRYLAAGLILVTYFKRSHYQTAPHEPVVRMHHALEPIAPSSELFLIDREEQAGADVMMTS